MAIRERSLLALMTICFFKGVWGVALALWRAVLGGTRGAAPGGRAAVHGDGGAGGLGARGEARRGGSRRDHGRERSWPYGEEGNPAEDEADEVQHDVQHGAQVRTRGRRAGGGGRERLGPGPHRRSEGKARPDTECRARNHARKIHPV